MIGQTVVNVKLGRARTRISTFVAGVFLLLLVTALSDVMAQIPMVALAAVMMIVALKTVNWHSVAPSTLKRMPLSETIVMLTTVAVVVATHNLAIGVAVGVGARDGAVRPPRRARRDGWSARSPTTECRSATVVHGPLFFGSSNDLVEQFSYGDDPASVVVDFSRAQIWDASTVAVLDSIETKYPEHGGTVTFTGLDERSTAFHDRLTGQLGA